MPVDAQTAGEYAVGLTGNDEKSAHPARVKAITRGPAPRTSSNTRSTDLAQYGYLAGEMTDGIRVDTNNLMPFIRDPRRRAELSRSVAQIAKR